MTAGVGGPGPGRPDGADASSGAARHRAGRRLRPATVLGLLLVAGGVVVIVFAVLAARDDGGATTSGPVPCTGPVGSGAAPSNGEVPPPPPVDPSTRYAKGRTPLCGFGEAVLQVIDTSGRSHRWCLLAAVTEAQRQRGLMAVTDPALGGYDAMVFSFESDRPGGFCMRNTPMPLSIAYVDAGGKVVDANAMAPCADRADCPSYPVDGPVPPRHRGAPGRPGPPRAHRRRHRPPRAGVGPLPGQGLLADGRRRPVAGNLSHPAGIMIGDAVSRPTSHYVARSNRSPAPHRRGPGHAGSRGR